LQAVVATFSEEKQQDGLFLGGTALRTIQRFWLRWSFYAKATSTRVENLRSMTRQAAHENLITPDVAVSIERTEKTERIESE
jgi:hypothetical protein